MVPASVIAEHIVATKQEVVDADERLRSRLSLFLDSEMFEVRRIMPGPGGRGQRVPG